jgi:tetratricopeptide (TPR) repeat protein
VILPGIVAAIAALAAHHQVLFNGFINVDDGPYVTNNAAVRAGLSVNGLIWAFTAFHSYNWHPLTWLSHMADVSVWGLEPTGHHLTSWLLHSLNAFLLYLILWRATGASWRSGVVALLFAVHPVHVESVAWVAERKDVLSTAFFLLTLMAYVGKPGVPLGRRAYGLSLAFFALGLMAKPMLVMTPVLLLLLDVWPLGRLEPGRRLLSPWRAVTDKVPFFALSLASAAITVLAQNQGGQGAVLYESPWSLNAGNALLAYVRYLGILVWPTRLSFVYPFRVAAITWPAVMAAGVVLTATTAFAVQHRRSRPYLLFGWLWYLLALLPVAGFVRFGYQALADRYLYIPAIGLYVAVVWAVADVSRHLGRHRWHVLVAMTTAALLALSALTVRQSLLWRSSVPLMERAIALHPDNPLPHRALGRAYAELGQLDRAFGHTRTGLLLEAQDVALLHPGSPEAHHRLGAALAESGRNGEAVLAFRRALDLNAARPQTWNSLGVSLGRLGRLDEAADAFRTVLHLVPGDPTATRNLRELEHRGPDGPASRAETGHPGGVR